MLQSETADLTKLIHDHNPLQGLDLKCFKINHKQSNEIPYVSITYKINKIGKNTGNPIPRARNANIYGKANIRPCVNISTYVVTIFRFFMSFKYQGAEELDINIDGNRVAIMFFKYFWWVRRFKDRGESRAAATSKTWQLRLWLTRPIVTITLFLLSILILTTASPDQIYAICSSLSFQEYKTQKNTGCK